MFKKKCPRCEKKIEKSYDYCPHCGHNISKEGDYGLLGKNDFEEINQTNLLGGSFMEKLFSTAMNMVEKQVKQMSNPSNFQNQNKNQNQNQGIPQNPLNNTNFRLVINGKEVKLPNQAMPTQNTTKQNQTPKQNINPQNSISKEKLNKFSKLPKEEPKSKIKRINGRIIYEISIPGVKNIEDILITRLENSIEIKAFSEDKVYSKNLHINLPIKGYKLFEENLILELEGK